MRPALILALTLVACAAAPGNNWPSLARRPAEKIAAGLASAPAGAAEAPQAAPAPTVSVANSRVAQVAHDLDALEKRWAAQKETIEKAVAAARSAARDSEAWSTAQVELTRFGKVGAQAGDIRDRLNSIAGDLASAAARGEDVAVPLAAAGKLIDRADALAAKHAEAAKTVQLPGK